ncbi:hypothetical protein GCM10007939_26560 [Amylibacter marinus]|uniref:Lipoprotein n=1 Tax=Amylibacter marinus TaxID=1475483 RepID=A0ABQ5VY44_9RHOB|nr:hypothetical protein [Amylibacter marinus]GLQ36372.1 hypothetical protein GCM10007939_26560 [Amylibacter marinus]
MHLTKPFCTLLLAVNLAACGNVVLPTVAQLANISPLEADPAGFEVLVDLPTGVSIRPQSAVLTLSAVHEMQSKEISGAYVLEQAPSDMGLRLFRIAPADLEQIREFQSIARAWESEDPDASHGSISVNVIACALGDGPASDAVFSLSLKTRTTGEFMPLIRNASVRDILDPGATSKQPIGVKQCG